jgi:glucose/arabinose dehydrogenase
MIRITADGDIPQDNPYTAQNSFNSARCAETGLVPSGSPPDTVCEEIVATGLRNPFRFAMDPNTPDGVVRLFFNDVGGSAASIYKPHDAPPNGPRETRAPRWNWP